MLKTEFLRSKTDRNKRNNNLLGKIRESNLKVVKCTRCILERYVTKIKIYVRKVFAKAFVCLTICKDKGLAVCNLKF